MNGSLRQTGDVFQDFARLQHQLNQIFGRSPASHSIRALAQGSFPAVNVGKTPETIEIVAFAPGIDSKSLEVTTDKGLLIIAGQRQSELSGIAKTASVYANERFSGAFRRVISLPDDADANRIEATYRDGILRITIAKSEASKPRRISVH